MKNKLSFFDIIMYRRNAFLQKNTVPTLDCFSSKGTGQLIAMRGIRKSEDYIKVLDENLNYQRKIVIYVGDLLSSIIMIPNIN